MRTLTCLPIQAAGVPERVSWNVSQLAPSSQSASPPAAGGTPVPVPVQVTFVVVEGAIVPEGGSAAKLNMARPTPATQKMKANRTRKVEKADSGDVVFFIGMGVVFGCGTEDFFERRELSLFSALCGMES